MGSALHLYSKHLRDQTEGDYFAFILLNYKDLLLTLLPALPNRYPLWTINFRAVPLVTGVEAPLTSLAFGTDLLLLKGPLEI